MRIFKKSNIDFKEEKIPTPKSKIVGNIKDFVDTQLTEDNFAKQFPFILFLAFLGILYIGNQYHAEKTVNQVAKLKKTRDEKRSEYITTESNLMYISRQSEIKKLIKEKKMGLKALTKPPKKIVIE
jgi:hypothetical protein